MKVAVIGLGTMGLPMAVHIARHGHVLSVYDIRAAAQAEARAAGLEPHTSAREAAQGADVALLMVATDAQVSEVAGALLEAEAPPKVIAVAATVRPHTLTVLADQCTPRGVSLLDVPVVYGTERVKNGTLLTLAGGDPDILAEVREVFLAYSCEVLWVGPLGAGEVAKMANNMLHWAITVADFEVLSLVRRMGLSVERMRQVLQACPAANQTLDRWQGSRFTWAEKDMDVALEVAQDQHLPLPLAGLVDQLIKGFTPGMIQDLMRVPQE